MKQTTNCSSFNLTFRPSGSFRRRTYQQIKNFKKLKILVGLQIDKNLTSFHASEKNVTVMFITDKFMLFQVYTHLKIHIEKYTLVLGAHRLVYHIYTVWMYVYRYAFYK